MNREFQGMLRGPVAGGGKARPAPGTGASPLVAAVFGMAALLAAATSDAQPPTPRAASEEEPGRRGCQVTTIPTKTPWRDGETVLCDLDGDGAADRIRVTFNPDGWSFMVNVDRVQAAGSGASLDETFAIVDVDSLDGLREIAVTENAGNPDHVTYFFCYDGAHLFSMGSIPGSEDVRVDGSGTIRTVVPGRVLQQWSYTVPYRLGKDHRIERVPVDLFPMNTTVVAKKPLRLLKSRTNLLPAYELAAGDTAVIVSSDDVQWCLVRNALGQMGWFSIDANGDLSGDAGSPGDVFEGLRLE